MIDPFKELHQANVENAASLNICNATANRLLQDFERMIAKLELIETEIGKKQK